MRDTESVEQTSLALDLAPTSMVIDRLIDGQRRAIEAVAAAGAELAAAVDAAAHRLGAAEGRLVMVGAGASGRICVQDGAELWPTFGWPASRLLLSIAGGPDALIDSVEGAEDDADAARSEVRTHGVGADDVVIAVAASGSSPWTLGWLDATRRAGALCIGMANNPHAPLLTLADHPILLRSGAEVLAGSTRLAAGTAQKAALNAFSTALMVRLNRTHEGLMVDMAAVNTKLDQRRITMLQRIVANLDDASAQRALDASGGWVKLAVLVASGASVTEARARLEACQGSLREAMAPRD